MEAVQSSGRVPSLKSGDLGFKTRSNHKFNLFVMVSGGNFSAALVNSIVVSSWYFIGPEKPLREMVYYVSMAVQLITRNSRQKKRPSTSGNTLGFL